MIDTEPQSIKDIISKKKSIKPPAYEWQELALRVIKELGIPDFKRNSVFQVCRNNSKAIVEQYLNDTKELCKTGERWKYFFKLTSKN